MKKLVLFFAFLFVLGLATSNAQSCSSSASAGKSCCAGKISKAAAADPNIEKRMSDDGTVAYVRKEADAQGNVKFVSVQYDEATNAFVNVAPKTMPAEAKACCAKKTASCSAAEQKSCSPSEKKACAGAGAGKACCKSAEKKAEQ
ncbi:MAG: hypothetical protein IT269_07435 [Saprospiraceae bacterium]|nr:hypothetical protein [Saprospiraceae bacterium]